MASAVGLLKVIFSADTAEFSREIERANGNITSFGDAITKLGPIVAAGAATVAGSALAMAMSTKTAAVEINRLSQVAGANTQDFQFYAAGAAAAGVDMDKFADILKDVQDKIGDFQTTGGGPLKDFFDTVGAKAGITAESFRNLSGPQSLQLFYSTLEKANVSQADMVFWLESIASDATLLQPLLRDNGKGFDEAGQAAEKYGAIISGSTITASVELEKNITAVHSRLSGFRNTIASELIPVLLTGSEWLLDFGESGGIAEVAADALGEALKIVVFGVASVATGFEQLGMTIGVLVAQMQMVAQFDFEGAAAAGNAYYQDLEASGQRLTNLFNRLYAGTDEVKEGMEEVLPAVVATAGALGNGAAATKKSGDAAKEAAEAYKAFANAIQSAHDESMAAAEADAELLRIARDGLDSLKDQVAAQKEANEEIGLSALALANLRARRLEDAAAQNEQTAASLESSYGNEQQIEAYRAKAQALRELAALQRDGAGQQAMVDFAAEFDATAQRINESLSEALFEAFQDGEGFAESFKRTLESYFKTMVLQPLLAPISAGIAGMTMGGGTGNMLTSGMSAAGTLAGAGSAFAGGMGWLTGSGATLGGTLSAAGSLMGTGSLAGMGSGLALGAGALAPIIAPLALLGLSGVFEKPSNRAAYGNVDLASGMPTFTGNMTGDKQASDETIAARDLLLANIGSVGRSIGASGSVGVDVGGRDGVQINYDGVLRKYGSDVNAALRDVFTRMLADTAGVESEFRAMVESMVETAPDQIAGMLALVSDNFSTLSTEGERFEAAQRALARGFADLGVRTPQTVADFQALAESIDLTTAEGRSLYSGLAALAPAFGEVASAVESVFASISSTTMDAIRTIETANLDRSSMYAYLDNEIDGLIEKLATATLPSEIEGLFSQINSKTLEAFGLLDTTEQMRLQNEFIDKLYEAEALAQNRLSVSPIDDESSGAASAAQQREAAAEQRAAAAEQREAAAEARRAAADLHAAMAALPNRIENVVRIVASETGY